MDAHEHVRKAGPCSALAYSGFAGQLRIAQGCKRSGRLMAREYRFDLLLFCQLVIKDAH